MPKAQNPTQLRIVDRRNQYLKYILNNITGYLNVCRELRITTSSKARRKTRGIIFERFQFE